jgi:hypothetical protein
MKNVSAGLSAPADGAAHRQGQQPNGRRDDPTLLGLRRLGLLGFFKAPS